MLFSCYKINNPMISEQAPWGASAPISQDFLFSPPIRLLVISS